MIASKAKDFRNFYNTVVDRQCIILLCGSPSQIVYGPSGTILTSVENHWFRRYILSYSLYIHCSTPGEPALIPHTHDQKHFCYGLPGFSSDVVYKKQQFLLLLFSLRLDTHYCTWSNMFQPGSPYLVARHNELRTTIFVIIHQVNARLSLISSKIAVNIAWPSPIIYSDCVFLGSRLSNISFSLLFIRKLAMTSTSMYKIILFMTNPSSIYNSVFWKLTCRIWS